MHAFIFSCCNVVVAVVAAAVVDAAADVVVDAVDFVAAFVDVLVDHRKVAYAAVVAAVVVVVAVVDVDADAFHRCRQHPCQRYQHPNRHHYRRPSFVVQPFACSAGDRDVVVVDYAVVVAAAAAQLQLVTSYDDCVWQQLVA